MLFNVFDFQDCHVYLHSGESARRGPRISHSVQIGADVSSAEKVQLFFQAVQQDGHDAAEGQIVNSREEQRPDQARISPVSLHEGFAHPDHLLQSDHARQRGILYQSDDLIGHGRNDALDHLQQSDPEKDLGPGHAEHMSGLLLPDGNALDAAPVDLGKIEGVIDDKGRRYGGKSPGLSASPGEQLHQRGNVIDDQDLQHQRRSPDDPNHGAGQPPQGRKPVHGAEGNDKPQWESADEGQKKQLDRFDKSLVQGGYDGLKFIRKEKHEVILRSCHQSSLDVVLAAAQTMTAGAVQAMKSRSKAEGAYASAFDKGQRLF